MRCVTRRLTGWMTTPPVVETPRIPVTTRYHGVDVTLDDDEEPVLDGACLNQHRALGVLDLLEHAGDPCQDAARRLGEQVDVAKQGDALDGQQHAMTLDPSTQRQGAIW